MTKEKLLVVDDDAMIRIALKTAFTRENMEVTEASSGAEAKQLLSHTCFDLIVLDVMLEDTDGFHVLQALRSSGNLTPVLMLSGKAEEMDQVLGLGLGADDYLAKPFHLSVLIQKVKALIRRNSVYSRTNSNMLTVGPFQFDLMKLESSKNSVPLHFTARELVLFRFFMEHPDQVFTREQLYHQIWGEAIVDDNTIMVYIKRLREKIEENVKRPVYLKTVRGIGYVFHAER